MKENNRIIRVPSSVVSGSTPFQRRLAMVLNNLPHQFSRRGLQKEVELTLYGFKGKILLPNGMPYPINNISHVLGEESAKGIGHILNMVDAQGRFNYRPRNQTLPRLQLLYCFVAIKYPDLAKHIVR